MRIVDVGRLGRRAVQLDDGEIGAGLELFDVTVTNIEASDEEAVECPGDRIDPLFQFRRDQMMSVEKQRSLAMIAGDSQYELFVSASRESACR